MTIRKSKSSEPTLFDWLRQAEQISQQHGRPRSGSLDIDKEFKAAMYDDIKRAADDTGRELSRFEIAARMSDFIGEEITKATLDNWTAPSHPHSMPAKYMPAFVHATGGQRRAVEVITRHAGLFALPGPEALRAEIQRLDEEERRIKAEKHKRKIFLQEIENGR